MPRPKKGDASPIRFDDSLSIRAGGVPLYHSVGHIIRSRVDSGEWRIDERIPSERELMEALRVSRATVRLGIDNLVKEGVLYRLRGKGTFVAHPKFDQGVPRLLDFFDTMRRNGLRPGARALDKATIVAPANVVARLGLPAGANVVWIQRLLLVDEAPMLIESAYFPAERFRGMGGAFDPSRDVRAFVAERYNVRITRESETFEPVILEPQEAGLLGVEPGSPGLWIEHLACEANGRPVAWLTGLVRGDRCRFYSDLTFR
jgi:GntR family transcriptional regulator